MALKKEKISLYKKGVSGNPNGRPKGTTLIPKELKILNAKLVAETNTKYFKYTLEQLKERIGDKKTPLLDLMILKAMHEIIRTGDTNKLEALLNRTVGKVMDKVSHDLTEEAKQGLNIIVSSDESIL